MVDGLWKSTIVFHKGTDTKGLDGIPLELLFRLDEDDYSEILNSYLGKFLIVGNKIPLESFEGPFFFQCVSVMPKRDFQIGLHITSPHLPTDMNFFSAVKLYAQIANNGYFNTRRPE